MLFLKCTQEKLQNQAHVTNAKDDPLQLAADAAVAVSLGFDEIETTMRVSNNSWSNALACAVGSSIGKAGTLFQCSCEEAEELAIGMAGFTSYAETVSVYGTESAFIDGDDTPWSKAWLTSAYASRGIEMYLWCSKLMGFHESKSLLYLESRCLCLQRAIGAQGTWWNRWSTFSIFHSWRSKRVNGRKSNCRLVGSGMRYWK